MPGPGLVWAGATGGHPNAASAAGCHGGAAVAAVRPGRTAAAAYRTVMVSTSLVTPRTAGVDIPVVTLPAPVRVPFSWKL